MQLQFTPILMLLWALAGMLSACEKNASQSATQNLCCPDAPRLEDNSPAGSSSDGAGFASPENALRTAEALNVSGARAEALEVMAAAYRRFPGNSAVISAYGRLALVNGQDELAARLLGEALAKSPEDWRALSALGVLESRRGNIAGARRAFARARTASGEDAVALNNMAVGLLLDGQPELAAPLLNQALAAPNLKPAHRRRVKRNLALALAMQGRFTEAETLAAEKFPRQLLVGRDQTSIAGESLVGRDQTSIAAQVLRADRATVRRFIGLGDLASPEAGSQPANRANSWRPAVEPAGS